MGTDKRRNHDSPSSSLSRHNGRSGCSKQLALDGLGIVALPLWMAKAPALRDLLVHVLPDWAPSPVPLVALYCSPNAVTPKIKKVLDFLGEYIGTDRDPRLEQTKASECFMSSRLQASR